VSTKKVPILEDFSWQLPVKDKDLYTPPGSPVKGDRYIIAATGSGLWSGHTGDIALCTVGGGSPSWEFVIKSEGMKVWVEDEDIYYFYDGSNWITSIGLFDIDINGDLEPVTSIQSDNNYELDGNDDIMPKA
jgi:hypothetical protein